MAAPLNRHRPPGQLVRAPAVESRGPHRPHHAVRPYGRGIARAARSGAGDVPGLAAHDLHVPGLVPTSSRGHVEPAQPLDRPAVSAESASRSAAVSAAIARITAFPPPRGSPAMAFLKVMPRDSRRASVTASARRSRSTARAAHGRSRHACCEWRSPPGTRLPGRGRRRPARDRAVSPAPPASGSPMPPALAGTAPPHRRKSLNRPSTPSAKNCSYSCSAIACVLRGEERAVAVERPGGRGARRGRHPRREAEEPAVRTRGDDHPLVLGRCRPRRRRSPARPAGAARS